jgi:hypothetical protein
MVVLELTEHLFACAETIDCVSWRVVIYLWGNSPLALCAVTVLFCL